MALTELMPKIVASGDGYVVVGKPVVFSLPEVQYWLRFLDVMVSRWNAALANREWGGAVVAEA